MTLHEANMYMGTHCQPGAFEMCVIYWVKYLTEPMNVRVVIILDFFSEFITLKRSKVKKVAKTC